MLLHFSAANYKSFREPFVFSMEPAPKQKGLDYSVFAEKAGKETVRGLCSSVIYGPNASGKTNIIGALDALKAILLRGSVLNSDESQGHRRSNVAAQHLELIPNSALTEPQPVTFSVRFLTEGWLFEYSLSADFGLFLQKSAKRSVLSEVLKVNGELLFERTGQSLRMAEPSKAVRTLFVSTGSDEEHALKERMALEALSPEELFLMNGFKTIYSPKLVAMIVRWLTEKLVIVCHADSVQLSPVDDVSLTHFNTILRPAVKAFGADGHDVVFARQSADASRPVLCSEVNGQMVPAEVYESYGTIRFVNLFPLILTALRGGGTLLVDEFDASIHPMALMSIVNAFHNDEINVHHAQIFFNTHNPIFLDADLMRRDEIKFVERNEETDSSRVYALSDFGTSGRNGVRKGGDFLKNYMNGRYGALPGADLSRVLLKAVAEEP